MARIYLECSALISILTRSIRIYGHFDRFHFFVFDKCENMAQTVWMFFLIVFAFPILVGISCFLYIISRFRYDSCLEGCG
jgi:hypothetical protein